MALGQRRAAAAKRYLESRGVASGRIDIVSFGEERPICEGHEESCWAQNRRGDFAIVSGGDMLTAPRE
jgi:peptidoglycan-associated lipoprotein